MAVIAREQTIELLKTGKYSDFTIKCGHKCFAVHRIIIASQSNYFRTAIDSGFKEASENEITIQEASSWVVAVVIVYLYFFEELRGKSFEAVAELFGETFADAFENEKDHTITDLDSTIQVYLLADRLMLEELRLATDRTIGHLLEEALRECDIERHDLFFNREVSGRAMPIAIDLIERLYTQLPATDDLIRPNLTVWILSHLHISRSALGMEQGQEDAGYDKILALAEQYDPEGVRTARLMLERMRDQSVAVVREFDIPEYNPNSSHAWR